MQKNSLKRCYLALDAGTTGVKAFVFGGDERMLARAYVPLRKSSPRAGWVEQDPREILTAAKNALRAAVLESGAKAFAGIGITNQRETTILWERRTGESIYPVIVWEDMRTTEQCAELEVAHGALVRKKTGLPIVPYLSATKIQWILDKVSGARARTEKGELCFGTVDSWLLWNLVEGHPHFTDYTNASRTLLLNIHKREWDDELLALFRIPRAMLPEVRRSASSFGTLVKDICGEAVPIRAVAGDQQASLYAAGTDVGTTKITFGTGIFIMQILGESFQLLPSFFTTLAASRDSRPVYALEAKINNCATRVTPLIGHEKELNALLDEFAEEVAGLVAQLPIRPKELVIDGGVTQAPHLRGALARATGSLIREHVLFDATALGLVRLIAR